MIYNQPRQSMYSNSNRMAQLSGMLNSFLNPPKTLHSSTKSLEARTKNVALKSQTVLNTWVSSQFIMGKLTSVKIFKI